MRGGARSARDRRARLLRRRADDPAVYEPPRPPARSRKGRTPEPGEQQESPGRLNVQRIDVSFGDRELEYGTPEKKEG